MLNVPKAFPYCKKCNTLRVFAVLAIVLLALPFVTDALLGRGWVRIADFALLYIMLALGLNIVVGYAGLLDLGYVAFYAVGAYMMGLLASPHLTETFPAIKAMFPAGLHAPIWVVIPLGAARTGITETAEKFKAGMDRARAPAPPR